MLLLMNNLVTDILINSCKRIALARRQGIATLPKATVALAIASAKSLGTVILADFVAVGWYAKLSLKYRLYRIALLVSGRCLLPSRASKIGRGPTCNWSLLLRDSIWGRDI